jgi:hypothetical protein
VIANISVEVENEISASASSSAPSIIGDSRR